MRNVATRRGIYVAASRGVLRRSFIDAFAIGGSVR